MLFVLNTGDIDGGIETFIWKIGLKLFIFTQDKVDHSVSDLTVGIRCEIFVSLFDSVDWKCAVYRSDSPMPFVIGDDLASFKYNWIF